VESVTHPTDPSGRHGDSAPDEPVTLAGFLVARLDETQALAEAANRNGYPSADFGPAHGWFVDPRQIGKPARPISLMEGKFAAAHDPSRVLREVEAGRKLLARWHEADSRRSVSAEDEARAWLLDGLLADRAAVWPDHAEFGNGWLT
jgi:hypothetical protein